MTGKELLPSIASRDYLRVGPHTTAFSVPIVEAREDFRKQKALAVTNLVEPSLLAVLQRQCEGTYRERVNSGGRIEFVYPGRASFALDMMLSRPEVLRWIEEVTECGPVQSVGGEVFRVRANGEDGLTWHDDLLDPQRRVALVVRLGDEAYEGGELELRERHGPVLLRHHYPAPGSAVLMKIDPMLQHRVLPVTAGGPRTVYGSWAHR